MRPPSRVSCLHTLPSVILLLCALACLPDASAAASWQRAGELLKAGDYAGAAAEAQTQLQTHPDDVVLMRIEGVCLLELGQPQAAIDWLTRALEADPGSVACRYYLAQAYAYQGSLAEAARTLQEVIAMAPESEYARLARETLPLLTNTVATEAVVTTTRRWSVYAHGGMEYDDNVPLRAKEDEDTSPQDSWRAVYSAYVELRPLDEQCQKTPFTLGLGYSYYGTRHDRAEFEDYDVSCHNGSAYISRSRRWLSRPLSLRAHGDFTSTDVGESPYSEVVEAGAEAEYQWCGPGVITPKYTWQDKDFEYDTADPASYSRDGTDQRVGAEHVLYMIGGRAALTLAYFYRRNDADGRQFRIESHDVAGKLSLALPLALRFYGLVEYREEDYTEYTPEPRRLDDVWTFYAALSRRVFHEAFRVEASYTYEMSDSNLMFSEYERSVAGIALSLAL